MTAVTVDLDDLETIVFATAAIKTIETTLAWGWNKLAEARGE